MGRSHSGIKMGTLQRVCRRPMNARKGRGNVNRIVSGERRGEELTVNDVSHLMSGGGLKRPRDSNGTKNRGGK